MMKIIYFIRKLLPVLVLLAAIRSDAQLTGTVNVYTPVLSMNVCDSIVVVGSTAGFAPEDKVLIIKMRGAFVDHRSPDGKVSQMNGAGMAEYGFIKSITGNTVKLKHYPINNYGSLTRGYVQMIKVARGDIMTTTGTITAPRWDGEKGGVVVINCCRLTLNHPIIVDGCGFRGGYYNSDPISYSPPNLTCVSSDKHYPHNSGWAGNKGEGIGSDNSWAAGDPNGAGYVAWSNGGGGGNNHNAGGGGGGNASAGGRGGNLFSNCLPGPSYYGRGGNGLGAGLFMGGGGRHTS